MLSSTTVHADQYAEIIKFKEGIFINYIKIKIKIKIKKNIYSLLITGIISSSLISLTSISSGILSSNCFNSFSSFSLI